MSPTGPSVSTLVPKLVIQFEKVVEILRSRASL